ncbi:MAG: DoxX family protein [Verrucomicrobia bacterium]|nr:DoxX family protein [Verrucomicrobiota bacterium]MBU6445835.1 DoxX family protein [Verrucomicrobiota bacterium]MDE3046740.1 DoxX family protein [Verrucomicrobiota bacterium]
MHIIRIIFAGIARFLIGLVFLAGAFNKILHWHETERNLHAVLSEWQSNMAFSDYAYESFSFLIPITPVLLLLALVMELLGALSILLGVKEKWGAWLLVLFLVPTTVIMHQFWSVDPSMREQQLAHFLKNMAILGGLIVVILQGIQQKSKNPFPKF